MMEINNNKIVVQNLIGIVLYIIRSITQSLYVFIRDMNLIGIVLYISIEIKSFAPKSAPSSTA